MEELNKINESALAKYIDNNIKAIIDDRTSIHLANESIEVTNRQFADLNEIVVDCARILGVRKPRVYIQDLPSLNAYTTNIADPVIVLHSSVLRRNFGSRELRFLIGHEMGHIACHHVKWEMIVRAIVEQVPRPIADVGLLPFLKWVRESEMSADNAGLICCQDLRVAEKTMVMLLLDVDSETAAKIDVDAALEQKRDLDLSKISEIAVWLEQLGVYDHPFFPDRIRQLRQYSKSPNYTHLWEKE